MNRRNFLNLSSKSQVKVTAMGGLNPYQGTWGESEAAHLLRRTTFVTTSEMIKNAVSQGVQQTLDTLFADLALPSPPLNYNFTEDTEVPIGATWVGKGYADTSINLDTYRMRSLTAWTMIRLLSGEVNIREKMVLFWHNHFPISDVNDARMVYNYVQLFRSNPMGNFRDLAKAITVDSAMLRYLNGSQNTKNAPNENYARELLELFTIGKGPIASPGDYTNYTEDDVRELAKALTGWKEPGARKQSVDSFFRSSQHDTTVKQLSSRFDSALISDMGAEEYKRVVDIIFEKDEVARFICRKLYRYFVSTHIDEQIEAEVILPMSEILISNDYVVKPALKALLSSEHFFNEQVKGCLIKHPLEFITQAFGGLKGSLPTTSLDATYRAYLNLFGVAINLQMTYYDVPSVAGWKAWYQEPQYTQSWLNSVTMPKRKQVTDAFALPNFNYGNIRYDIQGLELVEAMDDPLDIYKVIGEFVKLLFVKPLDDNQIQAIRDVVLPGLPDYEWPFEYNTYLQNKNDKATRDAIDLKVRAMLLYMMRMPEYQMI